MNFNIISNEGISHPFNSVFQKFFVVVITLFLAFQRAQNQELPSLNSSDNDREYATGEPKLYPAAMDTRSYYFTTLGNGLRVLLISNPYVMQSSVSLNVAAGSYYDPPDFMGLAHFCEHMIFYGTKQFPLADTFTNYVLAHGGYENAATSTADTTYYFNILSLYLDKSLHIFSQFFISPLFQEEHMQGELNVVNEEHQRRLQDPERKVTQLIKHVSSREHQFYKFCIGNLKTLNKSNLRDQLLQFYHQRYSANMVSEIALNKNVLGKLKFTSCVC